MHCAYGPWFLFPMLFWLIILALLIRAFIISPRWRNRATFAHHHQPQASTGATELDLLAKRYARGEIDTPTFDLMRERLENKDRPQS